MGLHMTSATLFSVQGATPAAAGTQAQVASQTAKPTQSNEQTPPAQGFKRVMDEEGQKLQEPQTAESSPSGDAREVVESVSEESSTLVQVVDQAVSSEQQAAAAALALPLLGQISAAENNSLTPSMLNADTAQTTPLQQALSLSSQIQLANGTGYSDGALSQQTPLPMMTVANANQMGEGEFNEFDHLMQQRLMTPVLQPLAQNAQQGTHDLQAQLQQATANLTKGQGVPSATSAEAATLTATNMNGLRPQVQGLNDMATQAEVDATAELQTELLTEQSQTQLEQNRLTSSSQQTAATLLDESAGMMEPMMDGLDSFESQSDLNQDLKAMLGDTKAEAAQAKNLKAEQAVNQAQMQPGFKIDVSPKDNRWGEIIAERIAIMNADNVQHARIQLDPPEMGVLEIRIRVLQDQVSVAFNSGHQMVRDALDSQSARLRDMLEQQGIQLADVSVSDQGQQSFAQQGEGEQGQAGSGEEGDFVGGESDTELTLTQQKVRVNTNLVDERA